MIAKRNLFLISAATMALCAPAVSSAQSKSDECTQEVLMSYFPDKFVSQTLDKFQVPQAQRAAIQKELAEKDKQVIPMVEEKAGKMTPNPLRDPQLRQEAVKIFRETLFELFASTMQAHGINDKTQIQSMLDDVQQQKAKQFAACMDRLGPQKEGTPAAPAAPKGPNMMRQQRGPAMNSEGNPAGQGIRQ